MKKQHLKEVFFHLITIFFNASYSWKEKLAYLSQSKAICETLIALEKKVTLLNSISVCVYEKKINCKTSCEYVNILYSFDTFLNCLYNIQSLHKRFQSYTFFHKFWKMNLIYNIHKTI